jgi:uncharacterized Zn finger protein (UPF0148 family)
MGLTIITRDPKALEEKFKQHMLKDERFARFPNLRRRTLDTMEVPICPRCERPMLRHTQRGEERGNATCPVCGYHGKPQMNVRVFFDNILHQR